MAGRKAKNAETEHVLASKTAISRGDKIFYGVNGAILFILLVMVVLPILYLFTNAFSSSEAVAAGRVILWPQVQHADKSFGIGVSLDGFRAVFKNSRILRGYMNTIIYTAVGTTINIVFTLLAAYPLSRPDLKGRNTIMMLFAFTMIFSGGMIPSYLLMKELHFLNSPLSLLIPGAISVYNMVICRTFFESTIAKELLEAARMDGCTDFRFFLKIAMPLSKSVLAVIALYYGVAHWNAYFNAFLYITDQSLYPLQIVLKDILISNTVSPDMLEGAVAGSVDLNLVHVLKYACIIVACLPIWCIYPFVQKSFVQGIMIGSIK